MYEQEFATPGDALAHFGIKGMRWGVRNDAPAVPVSGAARQYKSSDGIGHGSNQFELRRPKTLTVDHSKGFADVTPRKMTSKGQQNHDELVASLSKLRETYPEVAKLKVVIAPFSSIYGNPGRSAQAAVLHTKQDEVLIAYNDKMKPFSERKTKAWAEWVPGTKYPGYVGEHEMGHVIAVANKLTPPCWDISHEKSISKRIDRSYAYNDQLEANHKAAFKKHGLSFKEVSKLSPYAETSASEAYAELAGNYHTPQTRANMSPELQRKAKALFEDRS